MIFTPQHHLSSDASGLLRLICCCNPLSACCQRSRAVLAWNSQQWIKKCREVCVCCLYLCVCAESKHHHHPSWGEKTHRLSQNTHGLERVKMLVRSKFMKEQKNSVKVNNICKYFFFYYYSKKENSTFTEREKNKSKNCPLFF